MAKLQIDGIEVADIDAAKAVQVLRLVRDNGPGMVVPANSRQQLDLQRRACQQSAPGRDRPAACFRNAFYSDAIIRQKTADS